MQSGRGKALPQRFLLPRSEQALAAGRHLRRICRRRLRDRRTVRAHRSARVPARRRRRPARREPVCRRLLQAAVHLSAIRGGILRRGGRHALGTSRRPAISGRRGSAARDLVLRIAAEPVPILAAANGCGTPGAHGRRAGGMAGASPQHAQLRSGQSAAGRCDGSPKAWLHLDTFWLVVSQLYVLAGLAILALTVVTAISHGRRSDARSRPDVMSSPDARRAPAAVA